MKLKQVAVVAAAVLFATAAFSGDKGHQKMEIRVVSDDGSGESLIELDSDTLGFDLHEMQVGENRSVLDKSGRSVLITRTDDGFSLDVDGKTIDLPPVRGHHDARVRAHGAHGAHDADADVRIMRMHSGVGPAGKDGVVIFSAKEIDAATKDMIRSALEAAGHSEVRFADGKDGGPHQVHVIKEIHEVTEISE